jgi:hypothetical protein
MKYLQYILFILFTLFLINCGTDYAEEGKKAFENDDYSEAIKLLNLALKEDTTNHSYNEMICISYLKRGKELFERTRNLKALDGNFEEAKKYIPENKSQQFEDFYVEMHVYLAEAYIKTRAANEDERETYFENALNAVQSALELDSSNIKADSLLIALKELNFQRLIDKGQSLYNKARRTRNPDLYFMAEYYLKEARKFEATNATINGLLSKITQNTLPVLNYREGISLAISGVTRERKGIIMNLSIKNYTTKMFKMSLDKFILVDTEGQNYPVDRREMRKRELFGETCLADTVLNSSNPSASGIIAFDAPSDIDILSVNYKIDSKRTAKKFFR